VKNYNDRDSHRFSSYLVYVIGGMVDNIKKIRIIFTIQGQILEFGYGKLP